MKKLAFALAVIPSIAFAQQQPTSEMQAIALRLQREINESLACQANTINLQRELESLKAELAKLKEKPDAK